MQLRFASFVVINLRPDLHRQECAHAGRTKKSRPKAACSEKSGAESALAELLAAASAVEADLLALDFACITGHETSVLERGLERLR